MTAKAIYVKQFQVKAEIERYKHKDLNWFTQP